MNYLYTSLSAKGQTYVVKCCMLTLKVRRLWLMFCLFILERKEKTYIITSSYA